MVEPWAMKIRAAKDRVIAQMGELRGRRKDFGPRYEELIYCMIDVVYGNW